MKNHKLHTHTVRNGIGGAAPVPNDMEPPTTAGEIKRRSGQAPTSTAKPTGNTAVDAMTPPTVADILRERQGGK